MPQKTPLHFFLLKSVDLGSSGHCAFARRGPWRRREAQGSPAPGRVAGSRPPGCGPRGVMSPPSRRGRSRGHRQCPGDLHGRVGDVLFPSRRLLEKPGPPPRRQEPHVRAWAPGPTRGSWSACCPPAGARPPLLRGAASAQRPCVPRLLDVPGKGLLAFLARVPFEPPRSLLPAHVRVPPPEEQDASRP